MHSSESCERQRDRRPGAGKWYGVGICIGGGKGMGKCTAARLGKGSNKVPLYGRTWAVVGRWGTCVHGQGGLKIAGGRHVACAGTQNGRTCVGRKARRQLPGQVGAGARHNKVSQCLGLSNGGKGCGWQVAWLGRYVWVGGRQARGWA